MSSSASSAALLPAVAQGNVSAFEELYDRYSSTVYGLLLRILANADDAQEVLQETFVKVWTSASMFDVVRGSEVAWLISIARSRGIDRLRSRRTRMDREDEAGREISIFSSFVENATGADDAIHAEERQAVRGALAEPGAATHRTRARVLRRAFAIGDRDAPQPAAGDDQNADAAGDEEDEGAVGAVRLSPGRVLGA
jgi:RNA polymerase sigma factor (sigma-70 family)